MDNNKGCYAIAGSIYANYIIQSIALVIITQFSIDLSRQLDTDLIGIGYVASGIGFGKIFLMFAGGVLSDKFGRKPFIYVGMCCYLVFFIGMLFCDNIHIAFVLAMFIGAGNSFLDTGSMPALTECFPRSAGTASVLIKSFISMGTLILPFIVTFFHNKDIWFGYAFIGFVVYLLINGLVLSSKIFPSKHTVICGNVGDNHYYIGRPNIWFEGVCLMLMGFTTTATFVIILQWLPAIAEQGIGMDAMQSKQLISYYSIASIISVFITAYVVKKILKPIYCIIILPLLSAAILLVFLCNLTAEMSLIAAIGMGFTAAGGVLQLTLVVMQQLFPNRKGFAVGTMYTMSGLSFIVIPLIVPKLVIEQVSYAILVDLVMALASVILGLVVYLRFRKVIDMNKI
ncbi:sugar phosphate permease [Orbus hercynius]|uniref:Sugar phosphate permease n=1 Tax=Orbus hercynius TaxID=593135 RepID=A0A495RDC5_9GAMM|nr:MFS transporter [Orbus hercynius]RKS85266.1 sugar phosphate permease [Orbus hercynius]